MATTDPSEISPISVHSLDADQGPVVRSGSGGWRGLPMWAKGLAAGTFAAIVTGVSACIGLPVRPTPVPTAGPVTPVPSTVTPAPPTIVASPVSPSPTLYGTPAPVPTASPTSPYEQFPDDQNYGGTQTLELTLFPQSPGFRGEATLIAGRVSQLGLGSLPNRVGLDPETVGMVVIVQDAGGRIKDFTFPNSTLNCLHSLRTTGKEVPGGWVSNLYIPDAEQWTKPVPVEASFTVNREKVQVSSAMGENLVVQPSSDQSYPVLAKEDSGFVVPGRALSEPPAVRGAEPKGCER